jgi:hypothetical protein
MHPFDYMALLNYMQFERKPLDHTEPWLLESSRKTSITDI